MADGDQQRSLSEAFDRIEESILPGIAMMLDALLDAASTCPPGMEAGAYAAELRTVALQLEALTREVEAISPFQVDARDYLAARA